MQKLLIIVFIAVLVASCQKEEIRSDAYGNFETTPTMISSEARGKLLFLSVSEGEVLSKGALVAIIDTTQLHLQRKLFQSQLGTISLKTTDPNPEITVYEKQKSNLLRERNRLQKLVSAKAATSKQLDDIEGQIVVVDQQIKAARSKSSIANRGILAEKDPIRAQINLIDQQIRDSYIFNPINGTVINKLAESSEIVNFGSPLYTIADLTSLNLRAYSDASKLQDLKIDNEVTVIVDEENGSLRTIPGRVSWIASEAEFTPKTIQTRQERVNLVYALKVEVINDGRLKIGMPAEIMFEKDYHPNKTEKE